MTFRPRRDVSQTTVYEASGSELVAINTSLHLVFNNVAHPHFPWCRFRARLTAAVGRKGKCQFSASTTQSDDEPHNGLMIDFTQMTKTNLHTGRRGGDHLMNLHLAVRYDHPVD